MTYQPPQNILAAIYQLRKQQGAANPMPQGSGVDMSQPQQGQLPAPIMQQGGKAGGGLIGAASQAAGYDPSTMFGYQMPQQGAGGALGMISQMSGYAPNSLFGYQNQQGQSPNIMSLISNLFGGQK